MWLKGESHADIAEKTRYFDLEVPGPNGNSQLAEQWMPFDESSGEAVTSLASPPGMCVCV